MVHVAQLRQLRSGPQLIHHRRRQPQRKNTPTSTRIQRQTDTGLKIETIFKDLNLKSRYRTGDTDSPKIMHLTLFVNDNLNNIFHSSP